MTILEKGLQSANKVLSQGTASDNVQYISFAAARKIGYKFDLTVRSSKKKDGEMSKPYVAYSEPGETDPRAASLSIKLQESGELKVGQKIDEKDYQLVMWINNDELVHTIGKVGNPITLS